MKVSPIPAIILALISLSLSGCYRTQAEESPQHESHHERPKIVVTSPVRKDVVITHRYVCQIHSRRHIEVRALERGYLEKVNIQEGQRVEQGDVLFKILPPIYEAELNAKEAEAELKQIKYKNSKKLYEKGVVSDQELALAQAELAKARAEVNRARAELQFTRVKASYDGIVDRQFEQLGALVEEGDLLTTLSDNSVMWVYFNVPEARYLEYKQAELLDGEKDGLRYELLMANGKKFHYQGELGAVEADFDNETGNIDFRADFPNPDGLLRHGETGTILIHETLHDALVIPQLATYDILDKKYVYAVEEPDAKHGAESGRQDVANDGSEPAREHAGEQGAAPVGETAVQSAAVASTGKHCNEESAAPSSEHAAEHDAEAPGEDGKEHAGRHGVARQREIVVQNEKEDIFVIKSGVDADDKIVLEGVRHVRDGDKFEYEFREPEEVLANLKYHAE